MRVPSSKQSSTWVLTVFCAIFFSTAPALAQATSSIRGQVADQNGAALTGVTVTVRHVETNIERRLTTNSEGIYIADNLQPGGYELRVEATGFQRQLQRVTVLTGNTHTADFSLTVGSANETVTITSGAAQVNASDYKIDQVITRERIEELPLNGRNFLELAQMEPSTVVVQDLDPGGRANNFTQVRVGGVDPALTRITADGVSITDRVTGGAATNFSQESVQEFQITTANFDLSTGVTSIGAVNVVTRGGGNDLHGSAFFFFRDHNMSAFPALKRPTDPGDPSPLCADPQSESCRRAQDPFFVRRQTGFTLSGPAIKDRLFWFGNFEYINLTNVNEITFNRTVGDGGAFANTFNHIGSGFLRGHQTNIRLDYKVNDNHNAFLRWTEEHNRSLQAEEQMESAWERARNNAYNAVFGLTSVLSSRLVNDLRVNWNLLTNFNNSVTTEDCSDPIGCIGVGGPFITVGGTGFSMGSVDFSDRRNRTYQLTNNLSWQKGSHRIRFGGEWEKYIRFGLLNANAGGTITLFGPEQVRVLNPTIYANLPATLRNPAAGPITLADILQLPIQTFTISLGDPSSPAPYNREQARRTDRVRFFFQDGWQMRPSFTLTYGLSWVYETGLRNYDLPKPEYLRPILGGKDEDLLAPPREYGLFGPALGFAWSLGKSKKTVIRGGSGIYYDSDLGFTRIAERRLLGPVGNGLITVAGSSVANPFCTDNPRPTNPGTLCSNGQPPFLIGGATGATVTALTGAQVQSLIPGVVATRTPTGPLGTLPGPTNLELAKTGAGIFDANTRTPYTIQATGGVQREIMKNMVLNADFVMRRGVAFGGPHSIFSVDLNRFNAVTVIGPARPDLTFSLTPSGALPANTAPARVIRQCAAGEVGNISAQCSTGAISVFQSSANSRYLGLHVRLDKRFADHYQLTASYALSRYYSWNGIIDANNWHASYGPNAADQRHRLNISGIWELPEYKGEHRFIRGLASGWQLSGIGQVRSSLPINAGLFGLDHDGDGISTFYPKGTSVNSFGAGLSIDELKQAVANYNTDVILRSRPIVDVFGSNPTAAQLATCNLINPVNGQRMCPLRTPRNQAFQLINLPENFTIRDSAMSVDLRVTKTIKIKEDLRLRLIAEGFNIFNVANLGGYSGDLLNTDFAQPTTRGNTIFGSTGPRAFQFAARLSF
jgi:hypothetical protein